MGMYGAAPLLANTLSRRVAQWNRGEITHLVYEASSGLDYIGYDNNVISIDYEGHGKRW